MGAHVAGLYMGVAAYADDLVLIAPRRHAMLLMLNVRENYAERYNIMFSTDDDPRKSKNKCIFMVGKARNIVKPVPLQLCGQDLPWVDTATHPGHELWNMTLMWQEQGSLTRILKVRQSFGFASPAEVVRAL